MERYDIHKPADIIPQAGDSVLLMDRVKSAFATVFDAKKNEKGKLHNAFQNRYFVVFDTYEEAVIFCQQKLAPYIEKTDKKGPRLELRGIIEDHESGKSFVVINIIFINQKLQEENVTSLEDQFFGE